MHEILERLRKDLKRNADEATRASFHRFFKEKMVCYGVKTPIVSKVAKQYWKEIQGWKKKDVFALCEELFQSDVTEEAFVVNAWVPRLIDQLEEKDLVLFQRWIDQYVNNWAKCDGFCNHTVGDWIVKFPKAVPALLNWADAHNLWLRRAAAVSLIVPAKHGGFLKESLQIADKLLTDPEDMVQKGYGWLLKEASRQHTQEVFDYVMKNKYRMPRTALRYAIELMPKNMKVEAMKRSLGPQ